MHWGTHLFENKKEGRSVESVGAQRVSAIPSWMKRSCRWRYCFLMAMTRRYLDLCSRGRYLNRLPTPLSRWAWRRKSMIIERFVSICPWGEYDNHGTEENLKKTGRPPVFSQKPIHESIESGTFFRRTEKLSLSRDSL